MPRRPTQATKSSVRERKTGAIRAGLHRCQTVGVNDRQFDDLVRAHSPSLVTFARSLSRDRWSAEEAVQDTLVRAWKYIDSFDGRGSFEGWLLRICRNVIVDQSIAAAKRPVSVDDAVLERACGVTAIDDSHHITDLLRSLAPHQTEVLVVVGVLGYTYEDAAELLDVPIGTVRSRLTRARAAFARRLEDANTDSDTADHSGQAVAS